MKTNTKQYTVSKSVRGVKLKSILAMMSLGPLIVQSGELPEVRRDSTIGNH